MKLAAIDIGSNAIRLQITHVINYKGKVTYKKVEYLRFPLRLGQDVFTLSRISPAKEEKFIKLMNVFKSLIDLYEVNDYYACATSAMREAANGIDICEKVTQQSGLEIKIIEGNLEAQLINKSLDALIDEKTYIHIDVGGGSTEFNLYVNKQIIASESFKIGSVRLLEKNENPDVWEEMQAWIKKNIKSEFGKVTAIGTGGNINKAYEIAGKATGKTISLSKLTEVKEYINKHSLEERINLLLMNPDRADVIVPALGIYTSVMKWSKTNKMLVPDVGLKDGLMHFLYERANSK